MTRAREMGNSPDEAMHQTAPADDGPQTWQHAWREGYTDAMTRCARLPYSAQPPRWRNDVADSAGRSREVVVSDADGRITVMPPPGGGFTLNPDQADLLALAIQAASNRVRRLAGR